MTIDPKVSLSQAFASFVNSGFGDDEGYASKSDRVHPEDFYFDDKPINLPFMEDPFPISSHSVPPEASRELERLKLRLGCGPPDAKSPTGCRGTLVFAYYGQSDPYWFVWRTCSASCAFGGDAIQELTRGDRHWEITSGGYIDRPKADVERLKRQVQKAEMFRIQIP